MSALSASKILIKGSCIPNGIPALSALDYRELGINTADGKIFAKTTNDVIVSFLNSLQAPFVLDQSLSSIMPQYGCNNISSVIGSVLNGDNNTISGNFAVIVNGTNNTISADGNYGSILGGKNNTLNHPETFIIGSNISSHLSGFTYVNNLTAAGKIYGDGSQLTGIVANGYDTEVRLLTSNWQHTLTTVQQNSANWNADLSSYAPLSGGTLSGSLSATSLSSTNLKIVANSGNVTLSVANSSVGINTDSPNQALTVVGDISATGSITAGSSANTVLYVASNGKVGINTQTSNKELTVVGSISSTDVIYTNSDVEVTDHTKGLILRSPNNARWRITITNTGSLSAVSLA